MQGTEVDVSSDILTSDHLVRGFELSFLCLFMCKSLSDFLKPCWHCFDLSLHQRTLDSRLSKIWSPFQLLCTSINENTRNLDSFLAELVHLIKVAASVFLPLTKVRVWTCKKEWSEDSELQSAKNRNKFWFRLWSNCG